MFHYALSGFLIFLTSFVLGFFVYFKNPAQKVSRYFLFFSLSVAAYGLGFFLQAKAQTSANEMLAIKIILSGAVFIPVFFLHLVYNLLKKRMKRIRYIYLFAFILEIINVFTDLLAKNPIPRLGFKAIFQSGTLYPVLMGYFSIFSTYALYKLYRGYKKEIGAKRNQLKYVFFSTLIGFSGGSPGFILGYGINLFPFNPYGTYCVSIYTVIFSYAMVKYRLMDINIAFTRFGIFTIIYFFVLSSSFWLGYATKSWVITTIYSVVFASLSPFAFNFLRRRAEDIILRDQRRYQSALKELGKKMTLVRDLDKLLEAIVLGVAISVKNEFTAVYIKEENNTYQLKESYPEESRKKLPADIPVDSFFVKSLQTYKRPLISDQVNLSEQVILKAGLVISFFIEDKLAGFLVMGQKPKKQLYNDDDRLFFENFSYSLSLAIENCRFWQGMEDLQRKARLQEMDTYSYSLAHEIDNPMYIIIGQAQFINKAIFEEPNLPENIRQEITASLEYILESAWRVSGMVKAIRDFGQPASDELNPLAIKEVVDTFSRLYMPQFKAHAVKFTQIVNEGIGQIRGEKTLLMQVLVILANNALFALKESQVKEIVVKVRQSNPDNLLIEFNDTGSGIPKDKLSIIFAPFVTTKSTQEGTGMGLYNAKRIVERHKGKIWAESDGVGKGASFFIELPVFKE